VIKEYLIGIVLAHLSCYKNTIDWVVYEQYKFIAHSLGGWKILDQGSMSGENLPSEL
jgi:hypothetical protein